MTKYFISCVTGEFGRHRERLRTTLTTEGNEVKVQDDFVTGGRTLLEKLDGYIKSSDAVIHLIGNSAGERATPAEVRTLLKVYPDFATELSELVDFLQLDPCPFTYAQWEAYLAFYHNVQCFIYIADQASREPPEHPRRSEAQERHLNLIGQLGKDRRMMSFDDPKDVALDVLRSQLGIASQTNHVARGACQSINAPPCAVPCYFQDRFIELGLLADFLRDDTRRLMTVIGRGGVGKSAMVQRFLKSVEFREPCEGHSTLPVDGIVYLSSIGSHAISVANLFRDLCKLLDAEAAMQLLAIYREEGATTHGKMIELLAAFTRCRVIVVLDCLESLQNGSTGVLTDAELRDALVSLLRAPQHGVKIVATTRVPLSGEIIYVEPGRQIRIDLDEGLPLEFATQVMRDLDPDGRAGLRDAEDEQLERAHKLTRGYPRALEAMFATLVGRAKSLEEVLADDLLKDVSDAKEGSVVEAWVGWTFDKLEALDQRVMEATAIFGLPVTADAVSYVLATDGNRQECKSVLSSLVTRHLVRKEGDKYYLHPVDQKYAMEQLDDGVGNDVSARLSQFTRIALRNRAAEYLIENTRNPDQWMSLQDIEPRLTAIEFLCTDLKFQQAFEILRELDFDYLMMWGHYSRVVQLHKRLRVGDLTTPAKSYSFHHVGLALEFQGNYRDAMTEYDAAIEFAKESRDRWQEADSVGNKGICLARLGETDRALKCLWRALRLTGYTRRRLFRMLGFKWDPHRSIAHLSNLGNRYADKGQEKLALRLHKKAVSLARWQQKHRPANYQLAVSLESCAQMLLLLERFDESIQSFREALRIADANGIIQVQSHARFGIGLVHLFLGELELARTQAEEALRYNLPENNHRVRMLLGIIRLGQGELNSSREALNDAVRHCERMLTLNSRNYVAWDTKGITLYALAACSNGREKEICSKDAAAAFDEARQLNREKGVVGWVNRLRDTIVQYTGETTIALGREAAT